MPDSSLSEFVQDLEFNRFTNSRYNVDFKGSGQLRINAEGTLYTFSGKRRGMFGAKSNEMIFKSEDIQNVVVSDSVVQFKTPLGKSGSKSVPFVFHLPDDSTAQSIAELLPDTKDVPHNEAQDFATSLEMVTGPIDGGLSITKVILALNVFVYVIMGVLGAGWVQTENLMPYILYGANNGAATTNGDWWRLITSMFMHYGILHMALNMWALYAAGGFLERMLGKRCYVLTYLSAGIAGGFASIGWNGDQVWSAGASGAVFGVFGALLGYIVRQKQAIPKSVYKSMLKSSLSFALYNILFGFSRSGIDNAAHLGGLAGGFVIAWLIALPLDRDVRAKQTGRRLQTGLVALAALVAIGVAATPRFDYRVADVMAWQDTNREFTAQEPALQQEQARMLDNLVNPIEIEKFANWLESETIPFYENWTVALTDLKLDPEKHTASVQKILLKIIDIKLTNYRQLIVDLRSGEPDARQRYEAGEELVVAEATRLQNSIE